LILKTFAWWDRRESFNARAQDGYTLPTPLKTARKCRLGDLELVPNSGPAMGTVYAGVAFHNISPTACALRGVPGVQLLDRRGTVWQSNASADSGFAITTVVLVPNSWATSGGWAVGASCGGSGVTSTLRLSLPGGTLTRDVPLALGSPGPSHCDDSGEPRPHPHRLGVKPIESIPFPHDGGDWILLTMFTPSLQVPASVRPGSVLHYTLTLVGDAPNGGGVDNQLCPLYDQHLSGIAGGGSYELRCDETIIVPPGAAVVYELQLKVPADAKLGLTTLRFQFLEPALPPVTAPVTVVA
jgi:hypothetical protein